MPIKYVPPRLWVIMAREAHKAVVIRKGPRDWSRLSLWDTDTDQVEHGQWLHAQIRGADLSPNGLLFVYSCFHSKSYYGASKEQREARAESGYSYLYRAISRPPYFTALALWNGGPSLDFVDNNTLLCRDELETHPDHPLSDKIQLVTEGGLSEADISARRGGLPRGWRLNNPDFFDNLRSGKRPYRNTDSYQFHHDNKAETYRLEVNWTSTTLAPIERYRFYTVQKLGTHAQVMIDGDLTWADWDQRGRLACADRGALYILDPENPNGERKLIADFNGQTFESILSPEWARQW